MSDTQTVDAAFDAAFEAALQRFVGREVGPPHAAPDEVNLPMVRHWCEAIGDENPVYLDPVAAAASVHGRLVAPPTMLQAWVMNGLRGPLRDSDSPYEQMNQLLFSHGFTSVVATNCEQTYHRYLHPGDIVVRTGSTRSVLRRPPGWNRSLHRDSVRTTSTLPASSSAACCSASSASGRRNVATSASTTAAARAAITPRQPCGSRR